MAKTLKEDLLTIVTETDKTVLQKEKRAQAARKREEREKAEELRRIQPLVKNAKKMTVSLERMASLFEKSGAEEAITGVFFTEYAYHNGKEIPAAIHFKVGYENYQIEPGSDTYDKALYYNAYKLKHEFTGIRYIPAYGGFRQTPEGMLKRIFKSAVDGLDRSQLTKLHRVLKKEPLNGLAL